MAKLKPGFRWAMKYGNHRGIIFISEKILKNPRFVHLVFMLGWYNSLKAV